ILAIGGDRNLGGIDGELEIALVEIVRAQRLEIPFQLLLRVLIVLAVPGEQAWGSQRELVEQVALAEYFIADDIDLMDLGHLAFGDVEVDGDAVPLQRRNGGRNFHRVHAARQVLGLELLLGFFQQAAVEDAALREADMLECFAQLVLVELLLADEVDLGDGRALDNRNDQDIALRLQAHIFKESGGEQRLDGLGCPLFGQGVADLDRQVAEYRSGLSALDALNADVFYQERLKGCGGE